VKKFIVKSVCFAALAVSVIGGACVAEIVAEIRAYRREIVAPEGASVLLCGDSQLGNAVDPSEGPEFFNFSAHGRTFDQAYLTMLDVLDAKENVGRLRKVLIDVSPAALTWLADHPAGDLDFSGKYYLIYLLHWCEAGKLRSMEGWLRVARDNLVGRRLRLFWRSLRGKGTFVSSLRGSFTPSDKAMLVESPESFAETVKIKLGHGRGFERVKDGDFSYRIIERTIEAARARSVEVVLVTTPWHDDLVRACGAESIGAFERTLSDFAKDHGCRYVNLLHRQFPADAWMDANHLNAKGAKLFTKILSDSVR